MDTIPLAEGVLCESCQTISRARNGHCPVCGGAGVALLNLAAVLNRTRAQEETQQWEGASMHPLDAQGVMEGARTGKISTSGKPPPMKFSDLEPVLRPPQPEVGLGEPSGLVTVSSRRWRVRTSFVEGFFGGFGTASVALVAVARSYEAKEWSCRMGAVAVSDEEAAEVFASQHGKDAGLTESEARALFPDVPAGWRYVRSGL